mgnify:FL=1
MIKIKKSNAVYKIEEKDLQSYLNDGFVKVEPKKPNKNLEVKEKKEVLPPKGKEEVKEKEEKK